MSERLGDQLLYYDHLYVMFFIAVQLLLRREVKSQSLWIQPRIKKKLNASHFSIFQLKKFWRNTETFRDEDSETLAAINFTTFQ